ncbi:MAG: cellulose biosynthesis protein BcsN [Rhizobiaceae bacterium]|nr:cellulose biosynthesis protein BcsN [Rhizobiaceae bacterium]
MDADPLTSALKLASNGVPVVALMAAVLFAAGCTTTPAGVETASVMTTVPTTSAYVVPAPGGPAVLDITQRSYANGSEQQIALATDSSVPGQNMIRARIYGRTDITVEDRPNLPRGSLAYPRVYRDMVSAVGGVRMAKSPYYVQNQYGPFGYAMGRSGDDLCMYGWQQLRSKPRLGASNGRVDVRVRICQRGATEQQLLAFMYSYSINAYVADSSWNPYDRGPAMPAQLGVPGAEIFPLGETRFEQVTAGPPREPRRRPAARASQRMANEASPAELPAPTGPIVPSPAVASNTAVLVPPPSNE